MADNIKEFAIGAAIGAGLWLAVDVLFTKLLDVVTSNQGMVYR